MLSFCVGAHPARDFQEWIVSTPVSILSSRTLWWSATSATVTTIAQNILSWRMFVTLFPSRRVWFSSWPFVVYSRWATSAPLLCYRPASMVSLRPGGGETWCYEWASDSFFPPQIQSYCPCCCPWWKAAKLPRTNALFQPTSCSTNCSHRRW